MTRRMSPRIALLAGLSLASAHAGEIPLGTHRFTLPDGFTIEVAAGSDLVPRPIAAAFDERGRLYVTDSSGSNAKTDQQLIDRPHRVVRLEDTDGDGRFDRRTVFADQLMLPQGAMWRDGSLYVGAPPHIWKLTDTDDDGVADQRVEWYDGKTLTGCANDLHGPYAAPDGWIYWTKGAFAEQTHERPGRPPLRDRASHIFRCRPDGSGLESIMAGGMDNPVDVAFTRLGEPIFSSTFLDLSGPGKRDGLGHAVFGSVFPKVNDAAEVVARTGDLLPALTHFGAGAPCGFARIEGRGLGDDLRDSFLTCLFNLHKVTRHQLAPAGATFRTIDSDFLISSNADFHPTDVIEDADGSLLVVDTGGWYKLCCPTSQLAKPDVLGAIYRIRRSGVEKVADPRGLRIAWGKLSPTALAALLADPRVAVVERATAELARHGAAAVAPVAEILAKANAPDARLAALWTLARLPAEAATPPLLTALDDKDASVRQVAARLAGLLRVKPAVERLIAIVSAADSPAHLRRVAAEALAQLRDPRAVPALLAAVTKAGNDRFLEHALTFALIEIGDAPALERAAKDAPVATRRAALIALSEMDGSPLPATALIPLLASPDATLKQTATWIASRHPDWGAALASHLRTRLEMPALADTERTDLEQLLAVMARDTSLQSAAATLLREGQPTTQLSILRAFGQAAVNPIPAAWIEATATALASTDPAVRREAVAAASRFVAKKEAAALVAPLLAVARDAQAATDLRLATLSSLPAGAVTPDAELFALLLSQLAPAQPAPTRVAAATVLARAKLDETQRDQLLAHFPKLGPLELSRLLPAFDRPLREPEARRFLAALQNSPALGSSLAAPLRTLFTKLPEAVRADADALLARLNLDAAQQRARFDAIAAELPPGDVYRGQLVFNSAKAACTSCHSMGYAGGKFGPDLTAIGEVRSERDLLEAIVFPSASFVRSYEPMQVRLKAGGELTGLLRSEASDAITLALAPGAEQRLARSDIAEIAPGSISLMPQGFDQILTRAELSDLVTFLKATTRKPR